MPVSVWNGTAWVPASFNVASGSFASAKSVKVFNGTDWVVAWTPVTASASLSFSKAGVVVGESYNVILTAPDGFPEGAVVRFRHGDYSSDSYPDAGATEAVMPSASHDSAQSVAWYADVMTTGGTTTFGPATQTVSSGSVTVTNATLSFSKVGVASGEVYQVILTAPDGFPASTSVRFRFTGYETTVSVSGQSVSLDASHVPLGDIAWYADVIAPGGTTTFGPATQTVQQSYVTVNGGHCHDIQAGMDAAVAQGKTLRLTGTFYVYTDVFIPSNLSILATGAKFNVNNCNGVYNAGRFKNATNGNAAQYGQAGWFVWDGGEFDGNGRGIFTISHSPGFTIKNTTMYRYCSSTYAGHAIEANSSGGADNVTGPYNVQILNNNFRGTDLGQRDNSNDEPIQFDWNWDGSGASAPVWHVGDPISQATQVMCHNFLIEGNTFHRLSESSPWNFAKCAIGGHDSADSRIVPTYRHNHFLIRGNTIHGAVGSNLTSPDKGAIHLFRVRQAVVQNNTIVGGTSGRYVTAEVASDVSTCSASGNSPSGANTIVVTG